MLNAAIPASSSSRTHVLEIVGNAIVGGMENQVAGLVANLPRERFAVTVLAPFESAFTEQLRALGAEVCITAIDEDPRWASIQLAASLVQTRGVDVLHAHLPNAHVLAGLAGRLTGRPVLATVHGRALTSLDIEVQRLAQSHLAVVCRHSFFQALGVGVDPRSLHHIANGVDIDRFRPVDERSGPLRTRFAISPAAPLVGFVGRLSFEKGPDLFLRAAHSIHTERPDARFIVVGEGPMLETLRAFCARFDLADVVHFAGAQTEMPAVFAELDVVVSSSRSEAMPLAVMEAMASGRPVVACKVGGVAELVEHGVSGWLVSEGDYEGLATCVVSYLGDDRARSDAGAAGRALAERRFALSESVAHTARLLEHLAAQRRGESRRIAPLHEAGRPIRASANASKAAPN